MSTMEFTVSKFREFLNKRKIMAAKCKKCGVINLPPRPICKNCRSSDLEWIELKGKGKLVTFSIVHVPPTPLIAEGHGREKPYAFGVVELEKGARITARLVGFDLKKPEKIQIGMDVEAEFLEKNGKTILTFKPAS